MPNKARMLGVDIITRDAEDDEGDEDYVDKDEDKDTNVDENDEEEYDQYIVVPDELIDAKGRFCEDSEPRVINRLIDFIDNVEYTGTCATSSTIITFPIPSIQVRDIGSIDIPLSEVMKATVRVSYKAL